MAKSYGLWQEPGVLGRWHSPHKGLLGNHPGHLVTIFSFSWGPGTTENWPGVSGIYWLSDIRILPTVQKSWEHCLIVVPRAALPLWSW